jgi:hypothetical protein
MRGNEQDEGGSGGATYTIMDTNDITKFYKFIL